MFGQLPGSVQLRVFPPTLMFSFLREQAALSLLLWFGLAVSQSGGNRDRRIPTMLDPWSRREGDE
jgi:hypothetical protein